MAATGFDDAVLRRLSSGFTGIPFAHSMSPATSASTAAGAMTTSLRHGFPSHISNTTHGFTSQPQHHHINGSSDNLNINHHKSHSLTSSASDRSSSKQSLSSKPATNKSNTSTSIKNKKEGQVPFSYPERRRARVASKPVAMATPPQLQQLNNKHYVFAYGTLKQGFPNSHLLDRATYLGEYRTVVSYPLVIAAPYYVPYLLDIPHSGSRVKGEMYAVDDATLADLDHLERVGSSHYSRLVAPVASCKDRATVVHAFVYFKTNSLDELVKNQFHDEYQCRRYVPRHLR